MSLYNIIVGLLVLVMVGGAVGVVTLKSLMSAAIIEGVVSLIIALLFLLMSAPDVAITEAVIGAGLSTALFVWSIKRLDEQSESRNEEASK